MVGADAAGPTGVRIRGGQLSVFRPHRIDWLAAVIQSLGTLFFTISTGRALAVTYASPDAADHRVWRPDAFGSTCFLVSSYPSYAEVWHGAAH